MEEKLSAEVATLEKKVTDIGKKAMKEKITIVGTIASGLSICMYVFYIPQIVGNLSGYQGDWIQPLVAFINCTTWVGYVFLKGSRLAHYFCQPPRNCLWSDRGYHRPVIIKKVRGPV